MPYSIMLDAGHGGVEPGAIYNGRQEKDDTLNLVLAVGQILQNNGIDVEYTRTTDIYESPLQKAREANEAGVDFFISIHRNSSPTPNQYMGVESLVYSLDGIKLEMAENINAELETVGFVDLGVRARPNLTVLRRTQMPAVLVEVGFINSDTDNQLFDDNFDAIAEAIARGILETLDMNHAGMPENPERPEMPERPQMPEGPQMPDNDDYSVQVGSFRNMMYAERLQRELTMEGFPAHIERFREFNRVRVGEELTLAEAAALEQRLKRQGYPTIIVNE